MSKIICIAFLFLLSVFAVKASDEKSEVLKSCENLFGQSVDKNLNLFEIDQLFVLQPEFDGSNLIELQIVPKYYFEKEHPDWTERDEIPQIPQNQFRELVEKIEKLHSKGVFFKKASSMAITNSTAWHYELYQNAFITYGIYEDWRETEREDLGVRWIRINFSKQVRSKVLKKERSQFYNAYTVTVQSDEDDKNFYHLYIVDRKTFDSLRKKKISTFKGIFMEVGLLKLFNLKLFKKK